MNTLSKQERIAVAGAIVGATILFFGGQIWNLVTGNAPSQASQANQQVINLENVSKTKGLEIYDEQAGTGAEAISGKTITVDYIGAFPNGQKFDSSIDRGQPATFTLGTPDLIKGWNLGLQGMKVGGIRRLVISPELGYGDKAFGPIPANSTLVFEVQLLGVK